MFYNTNPSNVEDFRTIIDKAVKALQDLDIDTVVCRGFSGATVAPVVAHALGVKWALVRKKGESTHSCRNIEGDIDGKYVIIDDFISTGDTVNKIIEEVGDKAKCVGVYLYDPVWLAGFTKEDSKGEAAARVTCAIINWLKPKAKKSLCKRQVSEVYGK